MRLTPATHPCHISSLPPTSIWAVRYPRPQLVRETWMPLNGEWEFALDHDAICRGPA